MKTVEIPLKQITPAPFQPRKEFPTKGLQELADSMDAQGLLQPLLVRPREDGYQLIAGERRYRAAQMLGWKEIRAEVREMDDFEAKEKSAVENFQRENLTSVEREDMIGVLWEDGGPNSATIRYPDYNSLAKALGLSNTAVYETIAARESRRRLGYSRRDPTNEKATTWDFKSTAGVKDDAIRKSLINKRISGKISATEIPDYAKAVKDAPKPLAEAVVSKPAVFTPRVAEAIKEIKSPERQEKVVKETIKGRLDAADAEALARSVVEYEDHEPEILAAQAEAEQKFQELLKMDALSRAEFREKMKTPEMQKVGKAFGNIMAHTDFERGIEMEGCCCPQCGSGPEKMGWMCCDLSVRDAIKEADKRHREIMAENRKKREEAKAHGN